MKDKIGLKFVLCAVSLLLGLAIPIVESNDAEDMKKVVDVDEMMVGGERNFSEPEGLNKDVMMLLVKKVEELEAKMEEQIKQISNDWKCSGDFMGFMMILDDIGTLKEDIKKEIGNNTTDEEEKAILLTGSDRAQQMSVISVEVLNEDGTPFCKLGNLGYARRMATLNGNILCGGAEYQIDTSCLFFLYGKWRYFHKILHKSRVHAVSWTRPDGGVQLMGGKDSQYTSEIVTKQGSSNESFPLKHLTSHACSIQLDSFVIITGGMGESSSSDLPQRLATYSKIVSKYDMNGWVEDLPSLNVARKDHGCAYYRRDNNELVFLVTGGISCVHGICTFRNGYKQARITSTEILPESASTWSFVGELPEAVSGIKGLTLNNNIFMTGGNIYHKSNSNQILKFDQENQEWKFVEGKLHDARSGHGMSVVPKSSVEEYCV